ncbi:MAG: protein-glutamate O-methyltransferase, partial [Rhodospirillaceae bacterium]
GTARALRILSAACASGEEPYTLAIIVKEAIADSSWDVSIRAVDINPVALEKARRAHFAPWALRETPPEAQRRWFHPVDRGMTLNDAIRTAVTFEARNLAVEDSELWQSGIYDAVYCRNVMMYFAPEQARALVSRIARSLMPGGYLFLGHAETLRGLSDEFHLRHTHGTFYYQRKDGPECPWSMTDYVVPRTGPIVTPITALADAWVDTIRQASDRIEALVSAPTAEKRPERSLAPAWDLTGAFDLLRDERFVDALAHIRTLPPGAGQDPDALLLEAMLLAHGSEFVAAADICRRLLMIDELNACAHYVLALCREGQGDRDGAIEQDRVAIYLDAAFAMPRLHLGLLARRTGDRVLARRELGQAQALLKHEDASRLLLFGGGFNRQALLALCDSALRDCGEQP